MGVPLKSLAPISQNWRSGLCFRDSR